jgi:propanol-preferring alcohol dehydrogenase
MLAYRLLQAHTQPEFQEVPEPHAGPGQVVVRVAGSGLCHTDFTVISRDLSHWKDEPPPFTLGHEIAGWVEELGIGVTKFQPGDAVAINPSWASCGRCHMCRSGEENHCLFQKGIRAPGVGYDGGHAAGPSGDLAGQHLGCHRHRWVGTLCGSVPSPVDRLTNRRGRLERS